MPNTREKLIAIIQEAVGGCAKYWAGLIANNLLAHGVTVQDGKPLEEFLHPIDAYKGLKGKYLVFKADTGAKVENCFVLRPDKDPAAVEALRAYANATDNKTLSEDIYNWVGKGVTVQELDGCEYCAGDRKPIQTDGGGELELVKIIPLPAIDLTTGEKGKTASAPYHALMFTAFEGKLEDIVPIRCCPMCGRRLPKPPKEDK